MPDTDFTATLVDDAVRGARTWSRLYGAAESLAIAEHAAASDHLVVAVVANTTELLQLESELAFFGGDRVPLHTLADWETLTYDRVSPHQDIVSQRIRTLHALPSLERGVLLLTAPALMQRLAPPSFLDRHSLVVERGATLDPNAFRERLVEAGYRHVAQVEEHGEFAVRGAILDLYPDEQRAPPSGSSSSTTRSRRSAPSIRTRSAGSRRAIGSSSCRPTSSR